MEGKDYIYDKGGNITEVRHIYHGRYEETDTYTYGNSEWKDLLTAYNGNEITYDEIGNPLTYYNGMEFKWTMGRRLESVKNGNTNVSYTYNADGLRTSKTVNNVKYNYYWDGDKLTGQTWQGNTLYFYYDKDGNPIGFDLNNNNYYYVTNLQGDIIAILSSSNGLLAEYEYDAWGNCTILYDTNDIADINPLRYRGYYYDTDTNLYYLQSRYYDANIGRFINVDDISRLINSFYSTNLYCYCFNNPINSNDVFGTENFKNTFKKKSGKWEVTTKIKNWFSSVTFKYTVTKSGWVRFDYKKNTYWSAIWRGWENTLATAVRSAAMKKSNNFKGRTIGGVKNELLLHYVAYKLGLLNMKAINDTAADIGPLYGKNFDINAWFFESVNASFLVTSFASGGIYSIASNIKKYWRYFK